ncbi:MAG: hypothetical protein EAZ13_08620 [Sphingobacteriia bacterium]|nr:MAG: hypothetical protein EAZ35_10940 [Sphingobacteriia bacterium]TAH06628.1 MAG: hypothetical protein EAZ13_08620 [Sphingobacteriia bacterium]
MKLYLALLFSHIFSLAFSQNKIQIGKHIYFRETQFSIEKVGNDILLYSTWYKYRLKNKQFGFTILENSKRNDTIFKKGKLEIDCNNKIINCKMIFFFGHLNDIDSSYRIFKQLKNGKFELLRYAEFRNGKEKILYPFVNK